jgi:hypothetical protein
MSFLNKINSLSDRCTNILCIRNCHILLIILGIGLRLKSYLENKSIWVDEAVTAISLGSRTFAQIFRGIEVFPELARPPLGFMLIIKSIISVFGNSELALRSFPFITGALAIILFYKIVKRFGSSSLTTIALTLFILIEPFNNYVGELKPYSSDVFCALCLYLYTFTYINKKVTFKTALIFGFLGAAIIWLSNAALFTLAGIGLTIGLFSLIRKEYKSILNLCVSAILWVLSFLGLYVTTLSQMTSNKSLLVTWPGAFPTGKILSLDTLTWLQNIWISFIKFPSGFIYIALTNVLILLSIYGLWKLNKRKELILWIMPIVITLIAAMAHKYPFKGRVILFLVPNIVFLCAYGLNYVLQKKSKFQLLFACAILGFILTPLLKLQTYHLTHIRTFYSENNRPIMEFFRDTYQPGDTVYLNTSAQLPFWYYSQRFNMHKKYPPLSASRLKKEGYLMPFFQFSRLQTHNNIEFIAYKLLVDVYNEDGYFQESLSKTTLEESQLIFKNRPAKLTAVNRAWLIVARTGGTEKEMMIDTFDHNGTKILEKHDRGGVSAYLYDFTK